MNNGYTLFGGRKIVCPGCGRTYPLDALHQGAKGTPATLVVTSIECDCGATWAIQRPRAVKADARGD